MDAVLGGHIDHVVHGLDHFGMADVALIAHGVAHVEGAHDEHVQAGLGHGLDVLNGLGMLDQRPHLAVLIAPLDVLAIVAQIVVLIAADPGAAAALAAVGALKTGLLHKGLGLGAALQLGDQHAHGTPVQSILGVLQIGGGNTDDGVNVGGLSGTDHVQAGVRAEVAVLHIEDDEVHPDIAAHLNSGGIVGLDPGADNGAVLHTLLDLTGLHRHNDYSFCKIFIIRGFANTVTMGRLYQVCPMTGWGS